MRIAADLSAVYEDRCQRDLRVMCGPRYNTFGPDADRREPPGRFFQPTVWKARPTLIEEDADRWDGLE